MILRTGTSSKSDCWSIGASVDKVGTPFLDFVRCP